MLHQLDVAIKVLLMLAMRGYYFKRLLYRSHLTKERGTPMADVAWSRCSVKWFIGIAMVFTSPVEDVKAKRL